MLVKQLPMFADIFNSKDRSNFQKILIHEMYTHNWTSSKYIVLILYFKLFYHLILLKYSNFIIHAIVSKEKRFSL